MTKLTKAALIAGTVSLVLGAGHAYACKTDVTLINQHSGQYDHGVVHRVHTQKKGKKVWLNNATVSITDIFSTYQHHLVTSRGKNKEFRLRVKYKPRSSTTWKHHKQWHYAYSDYSTCKKGHVVYLRPTDSTRK